MIAAVSAPITVAYAGYIPATWTTVYTVEGTFNSAVALRGLVFCNVSASAATFSVALRDASGVLGDDDWLMVDEHSLDPSETYFLAGDSILGVVLGNGETIDIIASAASSITTRICVEEQI